MAIALITPIVSTRTHIPQGIEGDRSIMRGKTLYFASITLIADVVSSQTHTQYRNPIAIGDWCGVLPLVLSRSANCVDSEAWGRATNEHGRRCGGLAGFNNRYFQGKRNVEAGMTCLELRAVGTLGVCWDARDEVDSKSFVT